MTDPTRRLLLAAMLAPLLPLPAAASGGRVLIVGGGWGGLSAAAQLRRLAPALSVTLVDRQPAFVSFADSNRWLVDHDGAAPPLRRDYAAVAAARGYRFVQAEALAVDRAARRLETSAGSLPYDWLVVAPGIAEDWSAWGVDETLTVDRLQREFSGGMLHAAALPALKARLQAFTGGDLVLTVPPLPYRCPPAPYERALLIAWWLKTRRIPGRLVIVDPNPLMPAFRKPLLDDFRDQVSYLDHARVRSIDLERRSLATDVDDIRFDLALLAPPQRAAGLLGPAGLLRADANDGRPDGWGAQDALGLHSRIDPNVFIIGDAAGVVSPLFGHYPKTGHVAAAMGAIVAARIAGGGDGEQLPASVCHLLTSPAPLQGTRLDVRYRRRGDGFLMQENGQARQADPLAAAAAWAAAHYATFL